MYGFNHSLTENGFYLHGPHLRGPVLLAGFISGSPSLAPVTLGASGAFQQVLEQP